MATISRLSVSLSANTSKLTKGLKGAKRKLKGFTDSVFSLKGALVGAIGVGSASGLVAGIIEANKEMQTLKSSLKTVTGSSEAAAAAFAKIKKFAITTPFDLNQWTEGFIKMKSLGLDPSEKALTSYGNTAAAMGKGLNQMIEAVADAATGEFERLKEFGIKASKYKDEVTFTFQGVTTVIKNNAKEIEGYLQGIGNNQFAGAMADQMDNLGPAFSNMGQSFTELAIAIGDAGLNDMVLSLTRSITDFTNSFTAERLLTIQNFFKGISDAVGWVADVFNAISWLQGSDMLKMWEQANPSQIASPGLPGYQLGDFNNAGKDPETLKAMEENNAFQAQILEAIRNQNNIAVAG